MSPSQGPQNLWGREWGQHWEMGGRAVSPNLTSGPEGTEEETLVGRGGSIPSVLWVTSPLKGWPHHPTHLLAASIVAELIITGMQRLPSIDGIQDHLVPHDHLWGQASRVRVGRAKAPGLSLVSVCSSKTWA